MPILLNCPKCQKKLRVGDEARGQQAQCPQCNTVFTVGGAVPPPVLLTVKPTDEDDGRAVGLEGRICPGCNENLAREAVVCVHCGFDLRSGKKLETVKERRRGPARRVERLWDGDIPMHIRGIVCGAIVAAVLFVSLLIASQEQVVGAFAVLILFVPMLLLAFGTFTRTQLSSSREEPVIKLTKLFCFFPFEKKTVQPRKYDKLGIEHTGESGEVLGLFVLLLLCACGLVPAIVYYLAFSGRFQLSLLAEGWEPVVVYRGQSEARMREIADAIGEASGLSLG